MLQTEKEVNAIRKLLLLGHTMTDNKVTKTSVGTTNAKNIPFYFLGVGGEGKCILIFAAR